MRVYETFIKVKKQSLRATGFIWVLVNSQSLAISYNSSRTFLPVIEE